MTVTRPLRVVQWTTGNVARQAVRAVLARDDLVLVGAFAHSSAKAGRDVAELVGLETPTRVLASSDAAELLALQPDCVIYTPLHFDLDEVVTILRSGANVITSAEFLTGATRDDEFVAALEAAATEGGSSIFGSGMNPGFLNAVAGVAAGASLGVRHVFVGESVDVSLYAGDANFDAFGWGREPDQPGLAQDIVQATAVFAEGLDALARILGVTNYEPRCTVDFALATKDLDLPGRPIPAGTIGGLDVRWEAILDGAPVIELHQRWVMSSELDPAWEVEHGWAIKVMGDPQIHIKLDVWPDTEDFSLLTPSYLHGIGMRLTGVPLVNAIPHVCAAPPGIRSYADLPIITTDLSARPPTLEDTP